MSAVFWVFGLGVGAGILTTLTGVGGGLLLLLVLSLAWGPTAALSSTSLALFAGNLHRGYLYRRAIAWPVARAFALGAVPGAVVGALAAVVVPPLVVNLLMALLTLLSVARAAGALRFRASPRSIAPAGFVIGGLTGTAGGAGMLTAPLLLSAGLGGDAYVGTIAASAVAMHLGRIAGYGLGGLFTPERLAWAGLLTLALVLGNLAGSRLKKLTARLPESVIEHAVLVVCVLLALAGIGRG